MVVSKSAEKKSEKILAEATRIICQQLDSNTEAVVLF